MAGRARRRSAATAVAGLVLLGSVATRMLVAHADAGPAQLGAYALTATAPGFEMTEDEPSAQAHPEGHGAAPETSTLRIPAATRRSPTPREIPQPVSLTTTGSGSSRTRRTSVSRP